MTVRRDLRALEAAGRAVRVAGGAIPADTGPASRLLESQPSPAQERIAAAALALLPADGTVLIGTGSTALQVARRLAATDSRITVVTGSLRVAVTLFAAPVQLILTGGTLRSEGLDLVGPLVENSLAEFHIDLFVTGCDGLIPLEGFFTADLDVAHTERKCVRRAERVMVVTESTKLGRKSLVRFAEPGDVSVVVTDRGIAATDRRALRARSTRVVAV
jgi:DeoR/GlpR family transcriptional regulator of sugar metabolism